MAGVTLIRGLEELERVGGLIDLMLPFILIFTIIFAIFQKTRILGQNRKNYNIAVALVIALMVVVPHVLNIYPADADPINILNNAIPNVSIVIIAVVMLLLLIGLLGGEATWIGGALSGWIAIISAIIILYIFGRAAGWFGGYNTPQWAWWIDDPDTQALIVILLVFGIIIWFITKEPSEKKEGVQLIKNLGDFFKKKD